MVTPTSDNRDDMLPYVRNPTDLLQKTGCKAITLSVSDNHSNILIWNDVVETDSSGKQVIVDENRSILKLTVVPGHRDQLDVTKRITDIAELDAFTKKTQPEDCQKVLHFLSKLDFHLTSESGAEYSYYSAAEKSSWLRALRYTFGLTQPSPCTNFKLELISPASKRQIERSLPSPAMSLIEETPKIYQSIVEPHIQSIVESGSLSWIENIVQGKKEVERILLDTHDYIINVDTKWRSHPDAKTVPKKDWYDHTSVEDLYCLAIAKDGRIRSLRDLRREHVSMLESILVEGHKVIDSVYGVKKDQIRVFVHYQPQFYQFHVHFTRLENEIGCQVERSHLLSDIIQNLLLDSDYYASRTISYKIKTSSEIYFMINEKKDA
jgi:m7GpppX diphosphatase